MISIITIDNKKIINHSNNLSHSAYLKVPTIKLNPTKPISSSVIEIKSVTVYLS